MVQQELNSPPQDFHTQIEHIGAAIEKRLHAAGIRTLDQLASSTPEELADILSDMIGFSPERIAKLDWIGQASQLAQAEMSREPALESETKNNRQHYAVYTLELLLDEDNTLRRMRAENVSSKQSNTWASLDMAGLANFLQSTTGLRLPDFQSPLPGLSRNVAASMPPRNDRTPELEGNVSLHSLEVRLTETSVPQRIVAHREPFTAFLGLNLSGIPGRLAGKLHYRVEIYGKNMDSGNRSLLGESQGMLGSTDQATVSVNCQPSSSGLHRLEAIASLDKSENGSHSQATTLMAMLESAPILFY